LTLPADQHGCKTSGLDWIRANDLAREQAAKLVTEARQGVTLVAQKRAQRSALIVAAAKNKTFKECAEAYMFFN